MSYPTMDSLDHFDFSVRQCGCVASRIFQEGIIGRVSAVFDRSFYVELENGLACIGTDRLDASPLNTTTSAPEYTNWHASGLRTNTKVSVSADRMKVGERFSFRLQNMAIWAPDKIFNPIVAANLKRGLAQFRTACTGRIPNEGLGRFIHGDNISVDEQSICKSAQTLINSLCAWLMASIREPNRNNDKDLQSLSALIGMGPGLTPSGDDFIGGMMIALHSLGEVEICRQLWIPTRRYALDAGNPIALAHLSAASEGLGNAGIHLVLGAIIEGRAEVFTNILAGIDTIGHTSGWDAMAGVVMGLDAWLQAGKL